MEGLIKKKISMIRFPLADVSSRRAVQVQPLCRHRQPQLLKRPINLFNIHYYLLAVAGQAG